MQRSITNGSYNKVKLYTIYICKSDYYTRHVSSFLVDKYWKAETNWQPHQFASGTARGRYVICWWMGSEDDDVRIAVKPLIYDIPNPKV